MEYLSTTVFLIIVVVLAIFFLLPGLALIGDNKVGILTKKMGGKKLPAGQIIARNTEIGVQAQILMPGLYWRFPLFWKIEKVPVTSIATNEIGVVESVDGQSIPTGRLLGDEVECNSFQDAKAFLDNGGKKGPQVAILRPGTYRINTKVFRITPRRMTAIPQDMLGLIIAQDGIPLPPGYIIAPKPLEGKSHKFFQDGQAFLDSNGYRGPQLDTLQPGEYYINPLLFQITASPVAEVPPGYVAVLRSNVGSELEEASLADRPSEVDASPTLRQTIHEVTETILNPYKDRRGILKDPVAPGRYNLNPIAYTPFLVPTSAVTIDWASSEKRNDSDYSASLKPTQEAVKTDEKSDKATEFFKFSQLTVTSQDGFKLQVDVRMVIRIRPEHAPFIIARFGSVANLIEQIVHPLIDSSFRNRAGEEKAIEFVKGRSKLQLVALERARTEFEQYFVEAQNLLIAYIDVDQALLETQTKKEIALQRQDQYKQEAAAEQERIQVQERSARATQQPSVVKAQLSIRIAKDEADALRMTARGDRDAAKTRAEGEARKIRQVGQATADAYKFQAEVVGPARLAVLKALEQVAAGQIKITPDILVSGADGQGASLFNAWLATILQDQQKKGKTTEASSEIAAEQTESAETASAEPAASAETPETTERMETDA